MANSIVAVSSLTGAGLEDLKRAMVAAAAEVRPRDSQAIARLPIDRVFTMKGFGTVVTGTLVAGTIRREDELEVFPTGRRVRVRGVQVHGQTADAAVAGQRTALEPGGREHRRFIARHDTGASGDVRDNAASRRAVATYCLPRRVR